MLGKRVPYANEFYAQHPEIFLRFRDLVDRVPAIERYLQARDRLRGVKSLLSIGAGDGALELRLAAAHGLRIAIVEPDDEYRRRFLQAAHERGLDGALGPCRGETFQDLAENVLGERFDLVLSVHSWYALGLDEGLLRRALALRAPGGKLLVFLASQEGPTAAIKALGRRAASDLTAEDLSRWALAHGHAHDFDVVPNALPADTLLDGAALTDDGRVFVSFLVAEPYDELAAAQRDAARQILIAHRQGNLVQLASGCLTFHAKAA